MTNKTRIMEILAPLTYSAEFVPQSKSRNAKEKQPSINWRVSLSKNGRTISTDYMQGIAHLSNYSHAFARAVVYDNAVRKACETGKNTLRSGQRNAYDAASAGTWAKPPPIPAPDLIDVFYSLVMDAGALDYAAFEDWADCYGYERDSRKAETMYRECLARALELRAMLGDSALAELRDLYSDY